MCSDTWSKTCLSVCFVASIVLNFEITVTLMDPNFPCMAHIQERGFQNSELSRDKISTESGFLALPKDIFSVSVMGINLCHDFCNVEHSSLNLCGKTPLLPKTCASLETIFPSDWTNIRAETWDCFCQGLDCYCLNYVSK